MALVSYLTPTFPAGSTAGMTAYRHGPAQSCIRSRSRPTKVKSDANRLSRGSIGTLSMLWELLTDAQRIGWGAYAFATPLIDAYSAPRYIKGYAHYMRANRPRLLNGLPLISNPPTTDGFPPYTNPQYLITVDATTLTILPNPADDWATEDNAYLCIWISRPTPPTRTQPPESYTLWGVIPGDSAFGAQPLTAATNLPPTPPPIRLWLRTAVTRADGRYTSQ